jgi:hypothetical protein
MGQRRNRSESLTIQTGPPDTKLWTRASVGKDGPSHHSAKGARILSIDIPTLIIDRRVNMGKVLSNFSYRYKPYRYKPPA